MSWVFNPSFSLPHPWIPLRGKPISLYFSWNPLSQADSLTRCQPAFVKLLLLLVRLSWLNAIAELTLGPAFKRHANWQTLNEFQNIWLVSTTDIIGRGLFKRYGIHGTLLFYQELSAQALLGTCNKKVHSSRVNSTRLLDRKHSSPEWHSCLFCTVFPKRALARLRERKHTRTQIFISLHMNHHRTGERPRCWLTVTMQGIFPKRSVATDQDASVQFVWSSSPVGSNQCNPIVYHVFETVPTCGELFFVMYSCGYH